MIYLEKNLKRNWIWFIIIGFVVLLAPQISLSSLNKSEAILGSIAYYFQFSHQYLTPLIQGQEVNAVQSFFPSLIMSLFSQDIPSEFQVRFHSFLAALILALLTANFTRKHSENRSSAVVAGLCSFSTFLVVTFATVGDLKMLSCFFLSAAWVIFYEYSLEKEWLKAWMYSLMVLSLAFLSGGLFYVFCFYFPFIFMRKKGIRIWRRLWHYQHLLALILITILFSILWFLLTSIFQNEEFFRTAFNSRITISTDFETEGLISTFLSFPFKAVMAFMPWFIFSWPIFCQSYNRVEAKPLLFSYMRTIIITIFIVTWLNPLGRISDLLVIVLPLSVMTGYHYPLLVRRYSKYFHRLIRLIFLFTMIVSLCLLIFYTQLRELFLIDCILMIITFFISVYYYLRISKISAIWLSFFIAIISFHWCYSAWNTVYSSFDDKINYKQNGLILSRGIPKGVMVYNFTDKLYIRQLFYIGRPVSKIFPTKELKHKVELDDTFETIAFRYYGNVKLATKLANLNLVNDGKMPKTVKIILPKEVYVIFYDAKPINFTANAADYDWNVISPAIKTNDNKNIQVWFGNKQR